MKTLLLLSALAATLVSAAAKMPGWNRPPPPEKAFVVMIGQEDRITIANAEFTAKQIEAILGAFVASTDLPALVIQIDDIDAPGKRRSHMIEILERVRAKSHPFDFWFVYSDNAKAQLAERRKAEQAGADQPATAPESKSGDNEKPQPESKSAPR